MSEDMTDPGDRTGRPVSAKYLASEPRSPDPTPVADVIASLFERYGGSDAVAAAQLLEEWPEVGGEWGGKARAVAVTDGALVLEVDSGGDATLIRYDEAVIRSRIQARFGPDLVQTIRVRVAGRRPRR